MIIINVVYEKSIPTNPRIIRINQINAKGMRTRLLVPPSRIPHWNPTWCHVLIPPGAAGVGDLHGLLNEQRGERLHHADPLRPRYGPAKRLKSLRISSAKLKHSWPYEPSLTMNIWIEFLDLTCKNRILEPNCDLDGDAPPRSLINNMIFDLGETAFIYETMCMSTVYTHVLKANILYTQTCGAKKMVRL